MKSLPFDEETFKYVVRTKYVEKKNETNAVII